MPSLQTLRWAIGCIVLYVGLDSLCGPPMQYRPIYPVWHPAAGLAVFVWLQFGSRALVPLLVAATISWWTIPILPDRLPTSLLLGLLPLPGYALIAWFLRRRLEPGEFLANHRGVLMWAAITAAVCLASGAIYASLVTGWHSVGSEAWQIITFRYGVAEAAGVLTVASLAYCLVDREARADFLERILRWESLAYLLLTALVIWVALHRSPTEPIVYCLLFLPLAWASARQGTAGAVASAVALEIGITAASLMPGPHAAQMPDVQLLLLTLILAGLLIGVAVDLALKANLELRRSLSLAAAGEMAGALAHELNQPLTALSAYSSACARLVEVNGGDPLLRKTVDSIVCEAQRASDVIKRLREFFRSGSAQLEPVLLGDLVQRVLPPFALQAQREQVALEVLPMPAVSIRGDPVQLDMVLRNLLANAFQALAQKEAGSARRVTIEAGREGDKAWLRIADNGPGIAHKIRARLFEPFTSTKSSGMGLGLAISRSIVEAHGGRLAVEPSPHGVFRITLPLAKTVPGTRDDD